MKQSLLEKLGKEILFFDGGTGSVLQTQGLLPGELPELWNLTHSDKIQNLHFNYYKAGANIIKTNTFGAFKTKFDNLSEILTAALNNAEQARTDILSENPDGSYFIALDIGPCGKLLKPLGDLSFDDAVNLFKTTIKLGLSVQSQNNTTIADVILIETMNDIYETKAAVIAAKEAVSEVFGDKIQFPIFVTNVYDENANLLTGSTPEIMCAMLESLGVNAFGVNCSLGPKEMIPIIERLCKVSSLPVIANPNAGLPRVEKGKTIFDVNPQEFAELVSVFIDKGVQLAGGCCGTTPHHIKLLVEKCRTKKLVPCLPKAITCVTSGCKYVSFENEPVLIGERINPTGKKVFKQALRDNDINYIINEGIKQVNAGCHILDVNVGLPEIDETKMMETVLEELQSVTDLPLQIDTTNIQTMERALRIYNGKPLVNSVNGKQENMDAVFPLVKKYGGTVIALTIDETGIPETAEGRLAIAQKIVLEAAKYGISTKDIIFDPLTMAVSTDTNAGRITLKALKLIQDKTGCKTSLGVSNISFGLPRRELVTSTFFALALENGLSAAIMNPLSLEMMNVYKAFCVINGTDKQCLNYIDYASNLPAAPVSRGTCSTGKPVIQPDNLKTLTPLQNAVMRGLKDNAASLTQSLLSEKSSMEIIDTELIPALDTAGVEFEARRIFLPQLLMCAEAAKSCFNVIRENLIKSGNKGKSKGKIIIATVKGDIHDIGKNIVKVLLENYSYEVFDLGKDVPPQTILESAQNNNIKMVGLSALMTTTVPAMEETIKLLKKNIPDCKICVGGAVLTQEYADMIGADFYGKDAMQTVRWANSLCDNKQ